MATLQSGKCFTVPTFFGMCCRSEWQERMYIYKWHEVDQTKHEIFCVHIVCNEIQVKVNLEITTFFFYLRFPYCPNFFWFGVVVKFSINWETLHWLLHHSLHTWCCGAELLRQQQSFYRCVRLEVALRRMISVWHQSTTRAIRKHKDLFALLWLSRYCVIQWSFCTAPLQVEHTLYFPAGESHQWLLCLKN